MTGVNLKSLLDVCNSFCTEALTRAAGQAVTRTHYEVTVEHFFLACLMEKQADFVLICEHFGLDLSRMERLLNGTLDDLRSGNSGRPVFSPMLIDLLENAWLLGSIDLKLTQIRTLAVLLAFLKRPALYARDSWADIMTAIPSDGLMREYGKVLSSSCENDTPKSAGPGETKIAQKDSFLARFCEDFTAKARNGNIDPVFGRDVEIRQMVDILARRRKNNPILVGDPGVGKTAVLEGLALRIVEGDVPDVLKGVSLLSLDLGLLEAGAGMKGEYERRLKGVLDEIRASEVPIILFIDEAHMLVGAGGAQGGSDAANLMKPALARGEIRTCAATTWKEYKKYFEKDPALARRFQPVHLAEPDVPTTTLILRGIRPHYEKAHGVLIRDDTLETAADYARRYITGRFLPDKAIDLVDTACARVRVGLSAKPAELEDKIRLLQAISREKKGLERDQANGLPIDASRLDELDGKIADLEKETAELTERWTKELECANRVISLRKTLLKARNFDTPKDDDADSSSEVSKEENIDVGDAQKAFEQAQDELHSLQGDHPLLQIDVTPEVVAKVVSDWTGIPVGRMAKEQALITKDLENLLAARIKGQSEALSVISRGLQASTAGLKDPRQPLGVFLLVGPSGVGKTQTGLMLADLLFGDESSVITINMSEFQEKHTVSRLIGSPPGYVGFGEGGLLTEAVRRRPYSVVLLDEVEKAHRDVLNLFYQVFDKGTLTDGEGTEVSFTNTILMLTSNLASDLIQEMSLNEESKNEDLLSLVRPVLSDHFRPALLARMTIVPYRSLDPSALQGITELKLSSLAQRLKENRGLELRWSTDLVEQIVKRCSETETGARNIDYILQGSVLPRLSRRILEHMSDGDLPLSVTLGVGEDSSFTIDFSE